MISSVPQKLAALAAGLYSAACQPRPLVGGDDAGGGQPDGSAEGNPGGELADASFERLACSTFPASPPLRTLAWSADGTTIVAGDWAKGTVPVLDAPSLTPRCAFDVSTAGVLAVVLSSDGTRVAAGGYDQIVRVLRIADGAILNELPVPFAALWLAFSPDGTHLAAAGAGQPSADRALVWRLPQGVVEREIPMSGINSVAFTTDGSAVLTGRGDSSVTRTRIGDGGVEWRWQGSNGVWGLAVSPDGELVAAGSFGYYGTITLLRARDGSVVSAIDRAGRDSITSVAFSPDSRLIASIAKQAGGTVWSVSDRTKVSAFGKFGGGPYASSVAFSPDGTMVAATGIDWNIGIWRADDGSLVAHR